MCFEENNKNGGSRSAEAEARSPWSKIKKGHHAGRESWVQVSVEVVAGVDSECGPSRPGHRGMLLWKALALLRPSTPFPVFKTRVNKAGEPCRGSRLQPDPVLSADTMAAPFPDTEGRLAFLTVILSCK